MSWIDYNLVFNWFLAVSVIVILSSGYKKRPSLLASLRELKVPQVRTYTRYGTWSVVMFDYAESSFVYYWEIPYK
ncbi:MAG: hypothetical protein IIT61_04530 [Bacteroidales bacterium]|nr:hypothetical protein [Bacteroidales bacterium]MBQ5457967.1 hypothetical protein [Bacteroidales bacterium]